MGIIPLTDGTVTVNHEWPVETRSYAYHEGYDIVSLEVDTDLGTAVVALDYGDLVDLAGVIEEYLSYYETIEEDEWNSR